MTALQLLQRHRLRKSRLCKRCRGSKNTNAVSARVAGPSFAQDSRFSTWKFRYLAVFPVRGSEKADFWPNSTNVEGTPPRFMGTRWSTSSVRRQEPDAGLFQRFLQNLAFDTIYPQAQQASRSRGEVTVFNRTELRAGFDPFAPRNEGSV